MSGHNAEDVDRHVKTYIKVFLALLVLTVVTVAVSYLDVSIAMAVFIGMAVALTKGTLVAGYFMHLFQEKKLIFLVLILMLIFFLILMFLPLLTTMDTTAV